MEEYPLVSMIIPTYNAAYYLPRLFGSIKRQTYPNLEVIIVDNGSIDATRDLCEAFAKKQKNVRVYYQRTEGVSMARNMGMDAAHGKYLVFCDADDWYTKDGVSALAEKIESTGADFCFGGLIQFGMRQKRIAGATKTFDSVTTPEEKLEYAGMLGMSCGATGKIFRRDLIENIGLQFPQGMKFAEDAMFVFQYLPLCRKYCSTDKQVYCYSQLVTDSASRKYYHLMSSWLYNVNGFYVRHLGYMGVDTGYICKMRCISYVKRFGQVCRHYAMGLEDDGYGMHLSYIREAAEIFNAELDRCEKYVDEYGTDGMDADDLEMMRLALHGKPDELSRLAVSSHKAEIAGYSDKRTRRLKKRLLPLYRYAIYRLKIGYND